MVQNSSSSSSSPSSMAQQASLSYINQSIASVNIANFISTKLQWLDCIPHTNYETWKEEMACLMESQGLMEYIDGTISPPKKEHNDYKVWKRNDALVKGWILGSLNDQIASTVLGWDSAYDVWHSLELMYGPEVNKVSNFVPAKLQWLASIPHTNYKTWEEDMVCLMESQGLVGYIDGTISPPQKEDDDYNDWKRNNALVKGWILGLLSDQIAPTVLGLDFAKDIWDNLELMYGPQGYMSAPLNSTLLASVNVANFVSTKLQSFPGTSDTNYKTWKKEMLYLMESHGLMDYIVGGISQFSLESTQDYEMWNRNDVYIQGWVVGSLSDEIASTIVENEDLDSACKIWNHLESKFDHPSSKSKPYDGSAKPKRSMNNSTPLQRAALRGDWEAAQQILTSDPEAKASCMDGEEDCTALDIAIGTGKKAINLVTNWIQMYHRDLLRFKNANGSSPLHTAASVNNKQAAILLVEIMPVLCHEKNKFEHLPIHEAALYGHREVLEYLIIHTKGDGFSNPYSDETGQRLLTYLIQAELFDIALDLAKDHPSLLQITSLSLDSPLTLLTKKMKALMSTSKLNILERLIASWNVSMEKTLRSHSTLSRTEDIEGMPNDTIHKSSGKCCHWLNFHRMVCSASTYLVPQKARNKIKVHQQAQQLLKSMCEEIGNQDFDLASRIFRDAILEAAKLDVQEVVEAIIDTFPGAMYSRGAPTQQHIFHKAIENRSVEVFNIIYKMNSSYRSFFISYSKDNCGNNPLHSAGKLAPTHKLNETPGAALQMQREMQWFKEVENIVHSHSKEEENIDGKTPEMLFMEEHALLKQAGGQWTKDTANSFTLVAVLIATIMFTGAVTVPGGNQSNSGFPMFSKELAFVAFAISDAISLFASTTSLLFFLAILTSRHAEEDFLYSLPKKLMLGLATLFLSVISMMVSFIVTLYLVFGQKRHWVLFPLLIFACMPVASFVFHQFPLLYALFSSTYGHGIFHRKNNRGFY